MLDATIAGPASNSYVSLDEANDYFAARFGTASWSSLSDTDKEKALRQAVVDLSSLRYKAQRLNYGQALDFPRVPQREGWHVIPTAVKRAQMEQALHLVQNSATGGVSNAQKMAQRGLAEFQTGTHRERMANPFTVAQMVLGPHAYQAILPWISFTGSVLMDQEQPSWYGAWPLGN